MSKIKPIIDDFIRAWIATAVLCALTGTVLAACSGGFPGNIMTYVIAIAQAFGMPGFLFPVAIIIFKEDDDSAYIYSCGVYYGAWAAYAVVKKLLLNGGVPDITSCFAISFAIAYSIYKFRIIKRELLSLKDKVDTMNPYFEFFCDRAKENGMPPYEYLERLNSMYPKK